jgi:hypothetical protein
MENLLQLHSVHHKLHMGCPGFEPGPPVWSLARRSGCGTSIWTNCRSCNPSVSPFVLVSERGGPRSSSLNLGSLSPDIGVCHFGARMYCDREISCQSTAQCLVNILFLCWLVGWLVSLVSCA